MKIALIGTEQEQSEIISWQDARYTYRTRIETTREYGTFAEIVL